LGSRALILSVDLCTVQQMTSQG